jgi:type I restriction enzyme S subunit
MIEPMARKFLGEICRFQAGDAFAVEEQGRLTGDHPLIKVSDMNLSGNEIFISRANNWISADGANKKYRLHDKGSVVFAKIGIALTYNRRRILTRSTAIDNNMMSATPISSVDARWFYFLLSTLDFNEISSGSALPYLTVKDLSKIRVDLPSLAHQKAVAAVLGALDDKIDLNRRMNETLETMARAIFTDWFVDFGPTRAKLEGRVPYLAPDLWGLFPEKFDGFSLPEGWRTGGLSEIASLVRDAVSPSSHPDEVYDHHSLPAYDTGKNPIREIGRGILSNKTIIPADAVLLSKLNPSILRVWLVDTDPTVTAIGSTEFIVLRPGNI